MLSRRFSLLIALSIGLIVGVGYPVVDVSLACRIPHSEACVWGKAYFPLTIGVSVVMLGSMTMGLVYAVLMWWRNRRSSDDAA
jgi:hypothetical protein